MAALEKGMPPWRTRLALFEEGTKLDRRLLPGAGRGEAEGGQADEGPDGAPVELPFGEEEQG